MEHLFLPSETAIPIPLLRPEMHLEPPEERRESQRTAQSPLRRIESALRFSIFLPTKPLRQIEI
jgi:hypothetical protein